MKIYLGLIAAAALTLAACGGEKPAESAAPSAPTEVSAPAEASASEVASEAAPAATEATPAASEAAPAVAAEAGECAVVITSDDMMKYDPKVMDIKSSCKQFTVTLKHVGKMPKAAMGHNVVIAKSADKDAVLADGLAATEKENYVKPNDERVIAHTKLIGGGEEDSVTFDVAKLKKGEAYEYFCSFPSHYANMHGQINLVD